MERIAHGYIDQPIFSPDRVSVTRVQLVNLTRARDCVPIVFCLEGLVAERVTGMIHKADAKPLHKK